MSTIVDTFAGYCWSALCKSHRVRKCHFHNSTADRRPQQFSLPLSGPYRGDPKIPGMSYLSVGSGRRMSRNGITSVVFKLAHGPFNSGGISASSRNSVSTQRLASFKSKGFAAEFETKVTSKV